MLAGVDDVRPAVSDEDRWYEETMQYFWFAERFGWPPQVVDEVPIRIIDRLPGVAAMHDEVKEEKQRTEADRAKQQ